MVEVRRQNLINAGGKPKLYISKKWLKSMGLDLDNNKEVKVSFDGEKIIIEKIK